MSLDRVSIKRWPDRYTLVGPPMIMKPIDEAVEALVCSTFMRPFFREIVKQRLLNGEVFSHHEDPSDGWRGRADGLVAEYALASMDDEVAHAEMLKHAESVGRTSTRKLAEVEYALNMVNNQEMEQRRVALPKQAKTILRTLINSGRSSFTEAAIGVLLDSAKEELNTVQEPMKIFNFYRKRLVGEGHLLTAQGG